MKQQSVPTKLAYIAHQFTALVTMLGVVTLLQAFLQYIVKTPLIETMTLVTLAAFLGATCLTLLIIVIALAIAAFTQELETVAEILMEDPSK